VNYVWQKRAVDRTFFFVNPHQSDPAQHVYQLPGLGVSEKENHYRKKPNDIFRER